MADEKKLTNEELTEEELNKAAGGIHRSTVKPCAETDTCYLCGSLKPVTEMMYTYIKNEKRHVCCNCMGLR